MAHRAPGDQGHCVSGSMFVEEFAWAHRHAHSAPFDVTSLFWGAVFQLCVSGAIVTATLASDLVAMIMLIPKEFF